MNPASILLWNPIASHSSTFCLLLSLLKYAIIEKYPKRCSHNMRKTNRFVLQLTDNRYYSQKYLCFF